MLKFKKQRINENSNLFKILACSQELCFSNGKIMTSILNLPDEILIYILSFLTTFEAITKISVVSKRFYNISQDSRIRRILYSSISKSSDIHTLKLALEGSRNLKSLSIHQKAEDLIAEHELESVIELCSRLRCLVLTNINLSGNVLKNLIKHGNCLENLNLENSKFCDGNVLKCIFQLTNLKCLKFSIWFSDDEEVVSIFNSVLPTLCKN